MKLKEIAEGITKHVSFQGSSTLNKVAALRYLTWLNAGNVGKHYKALEHLESI